MIKLKTLRSLTLQNLKNKKILVRVDFNVPIKEENKQKIIQDDRRIRNCFATINFLIKNQAKIILMSHLGRPKGEKNSHFSLKPIYEYFKQNTIMSVDFANDCVGQEVEQKINLLKVGQILILENLRFHPEEKKNDIQFAKKLASTVNIFVNEAFSASHRSHASIVGVSKFLPTFAGLALEKEVKTLEFLINKPKKPLIIIVGGAKISDKVDSIKNLAKIADAVLIGGGIANNFLKADGLEIHKSYLEDNPVSLNQVKDYIKVARKIIEKNKTEKILKDGYIPLPKILYPIDVVAAKDLKSSKTQIINLSHDMKDTANDLNLMYLDIGPKTIRLYQELIMQAATIFWNGPMGVFENPLFSKGTKEIARTIAKSGAMTVIGGGDTISAINKYNLEERFDYISTAGGAALEFLSGKILPGIKICIINQ